MAWVAEEDFEYSNGTDLTSQTGGSGWSAAWAKGGTTTKVADTSVKYANTASLKGVSASVGTGNHERQLTTDLTGDGNILYFALRRSSSSSGSHRVNFRNTTDSGRIDVWMASDGNIYLKGLPSGTQRTLVSGYSVDTWYVIRLTINVTSATATAAVSTDAYNTAGTFGTESASSAFTAGNLRYVLLDTDPNGVGSGVTMYWDYISPTSPFSTGGASTFVPKATFF